MKTSTSRLVRSTMSRIGPLTQEPSATGTPASWRSATIVRTPWRRSRGTSALIVSASSRNCSPATPDCVTICGVPSSVSPMNASLTPSKRLMTYRGKSMRPLDSRTTFALRNRKSAPVKLQFGRGSSGRQPPFCMHSSSSAPSSNSWLPTELTSRPRSFIASIVGSSWNSAESRGLAPMRSPADTTTVRRGLRASSALTWVARYSMPPARSQARRPVPPRRRVATACRSSGFAVPDALPDARRGWRTKPPRGDRAVNNDGGLRAHLLHRGHRPGAGDRQGRHDIGRGEQQEAEREEDPGRAVGRDPAPRQHLLDRDDRRHDRHPRDAHDAQREERRHERPAAADAPRAVPGAHLQRAGRAAAPRAEEGPERAAALPEAHVLQRRQLVGRRHQQRRPGDPPPGAVPRQDVAGDRAAGPRDGVRGDAGGAPDDEVAGGEEQRGQPVRRHARVQRDRRRERREHHRGHHHDPDADEPAERPERGPGPLVHALHAVRGRPPADGGDRAEERHEAEARAGRGERRRAGGIAPRRRGGDHAAQENSDVESPVLPSYEIPKALICDRFASAIVRSEPTGWNMPANLTGSPVSTPKGTMSSISKSIASPTRTPWRRPSSVTSIRARSTPSTWPTSGARPAIGPPSCPLKTFASLSACSSLACSSMNIPTRQFPSVITFGVSMITTAFRPATP